jgi:hypothetical protein
MVGDDDRPTIAAEAEWLAADGVANRGCRASGGKCGRAPFDLRRGRKVRQDRSITTDFSSDFQGSANPRTPERRRGREVKDHGAIRIGSVGVVGNRKLAVPTGPGPPWLAASHLGSRAGSPLGGDRRPTPSLGRPAFSTHPCGTGRPGRSCRGCSGLEPPTSSGRIRHPERSCARSPARSGRRPARPP